MLWKLFIVQRSRFEAFLLRDCGAKSMRKIDIVMPLPISIDLWLRGELTKK